MQNPALLLVLLVLAVRIIGPLVAASKKRAAQAAPPAEDSERTRRVQEEVARKIAERRRAAGAPAPVFPRAEAVPNRPVPAPFQRVAAPRAPDPDELAEIARQMRLEDQIRRIEAAQKSPAPASPFPAAGSVPVADGPAAWLRELGDHRGARRAIVLREVLGAPRGLSTEGCLWR